MGDFANYSHLGDNGMTHHFNLPSEEEIREWCDKTFYKDPENPKEFDEANYAAKKAIRWFRDRIKPVERLSESEIGLQAYQKSKALYGGVMVCDYVGGYRDGYRACEERLLDGK